MGLDLAIPTLAAVHGSFLGRLRREGEACVRQFAAETIPDLATAVGPESLIQGRKNITADLFKVVLPIGARAESSAQISPVPVSSLVGRRRRGGRVQRALATPIPVRRAEFIAYRNRKYSHVGMTAAGYLEAARELGVTLPGWIARHSGSEGSITIERSPGGVLLTVANEVPWAYWITGAMSRSGYAVQVKAGRYYDLAQAAWARASGRAD